MFGGNSVSTNKQHQSRGQRVAYLRVSSTDQNLGRQREAVHATGIIDREFTDQLSAKSKSHRPGLEDCINYLRYQDELIVVSIDRLARSIVDLRMIIDRINEKGASVHFIKENLSFNAGESDPRSLFMLAILGAFAEFERSVIRERQNDGIALAKKQGKYKGRKKTLSKEQVVELRERVANGESKSSVGRDFGIHRSTVYDYLEPPQQQRE